MTIIRTRVLVVLLVALLAAAPLRTGSIARTSAADSSLRSGWTQIDLPAPPGAAAVPLKTVRVGSSLIVIAAGDGPSQPLWVSTDGASWTRVTLDPAVFPPDTRITDITAGGPGLVAVGGKTLLKPGEQPYAAIWTSSDGVTWKRVADGAVFANASLGHIGTLSSGLVAFGTNFAASGTGGRPAVWTSRDGVLWTRHNLADEVFHGAVIGSVARRGQGLVAVGSQTPTGAPAHAAIWASTDGVAWSPLHLDPAVFPATASLFRVIGSSQGPLIDGTLSEPKRNPVFVTWVSTDGSTWLRSAADPFGQGVVRAVTAAGPGYVAVGEREGDPLLWSSVDGLTWTREIDGEVFKGASVTLADVSASASGIAIAGAASTSPDPAGTPLLWLWSPPAAAAATPIPTALPSRLDPKSLRLRLDELAPGFQIDLEGTAEICNLGGGPDPGHRCAKIKRALGTYHAYAFQFSNPGKSTHPPSVHGWVIVVRNGATARRILSVGPPIANELASAFYHRRAQRLRSAVKIGQETRIYRHEVNRLNPRQNAYSALWRDGRDIGEVLVGGLGRKPAIAAAIRYARILHQHYQNARG